MAVEMPLIVAYHPVNLFCEISFDAPVPSKFQFALQLLSLLAVEKCSTHWTYRFLLKQEPQAKGVSLSAEQLSETFHLAMDFICPRRTFLIVLTGMGFPSVLTMFSGSFHPVSVVVWIALRQLQAR